MKLRLLLLAAIGAVATLTIGGVALAEPSGVGGAPLGATLTGAAECNNAGVCGLGDPDATGTIQLRLNPGREEICFDVTTSGADPFFASHIHVAPAGIAGPIVVPTTGAFAGSTSACVPADRSLILAIMRDPAAYYFNAHNTAFPGGALRGQLGHIAPGQ